MVGKKDCQADAMISVILMAKILYQKKETGCEFSSLGKMVILFTKLEGLMIQPVRIVEEGKKSVGGKPRTKKFS